MVGTNPTVRPGGPLAVEQRPQLGDRGDGLHRAISVASTPSAGGHRVGRRRRRRGVAARRAAASASAASRASASRPRRVDHAPVGLALVGGQRPQVAAQRGLVAPGRGPGERRHGPEVGHVVERGAGEVEVGLERHARPLGQPLDLAHQRDQVVGGDARRRRGRSPGRRRRPRTPGRRARARPRRPAGRRPPRTRPPTSRRAPSSGVGSDTSGCTAARRGCGASTSRPREPARWATTVPSAGADRAGHVADRVVGRGQHQQVDALGGAGPRRRVRPSMGATSHPALVSARASEVPARPGPTMRTRRGRARGPRGAGRGGGVTARRAAHAARRSPSAAVDGRLVDQVGRQVVQGGQHEAALPHAGMGHDQVGLVDA